MTLKMDDEGDLHSENARVHVFIKQMMVSRVFAASYYDRCYVSSIKAYRDALNIYKEEKDFIRDLDIVKQRINNFYHGTMWAAISGPECQDSESKGSSGHRLWVKLENIPFGAYWFMIESVHISDGGEVIFKTKIIRKFVPDDKARTNQEAPVNWSEIKDDIFKVIKETVTWHNTKESIKFLFLLTMMIATALLYALQYLGEYSLRFFREFNNFVKVSTPIFLAILDAITKTIGGFYILLAMLWRGSSSPPSRADSFPSLNAPPPRQFRPIKPATYYQSRHRYE